MRLVEGKSILIPPLICGGFNADFDGDTMTAHLPILQRSRAEVWNTMWVPFNLVSPAHGGLTVSPSQDMVIGSFHITQ